MHSPADNIGRCWRVWGFGGFGRTLFINAPIGLFKESLDSLIVSSYNTPFYIKKYYSSYNFINNSNIYSVITKDIKKKMIMI